MPIRGPKYIITPGDWQQVQIDLNDLWDSLTAAINVATGGIVIDHNSLSGLQGGTTGQYYHLTAAQLAGLGAGGMIYPGVGIAVSTGSGWGTSITDNSTAWNAAQPALPAGTGFIKETPSGTFVLSAFGTATYIPVANGTGFSYDAALTFVSPNVIGTGYARFDGGIGINGNPVAGNINHMYSPTAAASVGYQLVASSSWYTPGNTNAAHRGINFNAIWTPSVSWVSANKTVTTLQGGLATVKLDTSNVSNNLNATVGTMIAYDATMSAARGASHTGLATVTTLYGFRALGASTSGGATITNVYSFYDAGQTVGATSSWGYYGKSTNNALEGNLRVGGSTAPAYALDATGDINCSGAFRSGGTAGINATVTYVDTLLGAKTLTFTKGILTAQV